MGTAPEPQLIFNPGLAWTLIGHLTRSGREECGGLLLGQRAAGKIRVSMMVLPPQVVRAPDHCVFQVQAIEIIRDAASGMQSERLRRLMSTIVGWVHTHPRLGLFLSHTDAGTFRTWQQLDPEAVAVVVDPFLGPQDTDRIAYWKGGSRTGGRIVSSPPPYRDQPKVLDAARVAEQLGRVCISGGTWDVVAPGNVASIYLPQRQAPTPDLAPDLAPDPAPDAREVSV